MNQDNRQRIYLQYTLAFLVVTAAVFSVLVLSHRSFVQYGDGYRQGYFWTVEYKNQIQDFLSGKGFHLWSWSRGTGLEYDISFFVDPFNLIAALFPIRFLELGITVASIGRMYLTGIAFLLFGREVRIPDASLLAAALCYTFSGWIIEVSTKQNQFTLNAFLFPLLILGAERIYKGKSPLAFILSVAYYLLWSFYFAYMAAIVLLIYIAVRYPAYAKEPGTPAFGRSYFRFIRYGLLGVLISGVSMIPVGLQMFGISLDSSKAATGMLFESAYYKDIGFRLLGRGQVTDYMDLGIPVLILLLFPLAVKRISKSSTPFLMSLILSVCYAVPIVCKLMNGMSYPTTRWVFTLIFFVTWCAAEQLDRKILMEKSSLIIMTVTWLILAAWTIGLALTGGRSMRKYELLFAVLQLAAGALMIVLAAAFGKKHRRPRRLPALLLAVNMLVLAIGWSGGFYANLDNFNRNSSVYKRLQISPYQALSKVDDADFYREDSGLGMERNQFTLYPANESAFWRNHTISIYNSRIPSTLLFFNRAVGNNMGYNRRVSISSNDNRMGLDYLFGVRYFAGRDENEEEYSHGDKFYEHFRDMDQLAGYGLEKVDTIDGVSIFRSRYETSIGYGFDRILPESAFMELSRLEREQALLQAVVVADDDVERAGGTVIGKEDLDIGIEDVPFSMEASDGVVLKDHKIRVKKNMGTVVLRLQKQPEGQLVVSIDNLIRNGSADKNIKISIENDQVSKLLNKQKSLQAIPNVVDYDYNLGYYDSEKTTDYIKLIFYKKGTYTYDDLKVSAMSGAAFDRAAARMEGMRLTDVTCRSSRLDGTVKADREETLVLTIPEHDNWDVYLDGIRQDRIQDADMTFLGVKVPEGEHAVTLKYHNRALNFGACLSLLGIAVTAWVLHKERKNKGVIKKYSRSRSRK